MAARDIIKGDIIEISFMLLPVSKKLPDNCKLFTCRAYLVQPISDITEAFPYLEIIPDGNRKDWLEVYWEQRSANRKGVVVVPPDYVAQEVFKKLPRVKLVRRPR
jgi:hypothetical protein